ncbi:prolyl oligopeptidase family serine peptidase [Lentzea sp. BCCO 10_0798]|uniref:Prolyl oligopeptidase family serine peptidase n=1 Tax=Lentzea kristufekii TaxID=3095430 RepID=A0ABU4TI73_9PSEU|nr:prolyl oligopeptidase family serine peptidase [Lentzea sp. BCCO 10_0798]MDX8047977.1 prolyl oligopeptidase family serine peptidase [Lentzea sp. BCCO 10_0798]
MGNDISFPRQQARTQRFTVGAPRTFAVSADGARVFFLRPATATSRANGLWELNTTTGVERLLVDPATLLSDPEDLPAEEKARRERTRESGAGIVGYALSRDASVASFALSGRLFVADLVSGTARELPTRGGVVDPRVDPTGRRVAYVTNGTLRVVELSSGEDYAVAEPDGEDVTFGLAEFIAAEEMSRYRGYWWEPNGNRLIAARVNNAPVQRWYIADPANPGTAATEIAYPAAGTANATVSLHVVSLDTTFVPVLLEFDYLNDVHWSSGGAPLITTQTRDQRTRRIYTLSPETGAVTELAVETDPTWLEVSDGAPAWTPDGRLVRIVGEGDEYALRVGDEVLTSGLQVRRVLDIADDSILVAASEADDPTQVHVYSVGGSIERLSSEDGVHSAIRGGDTVVLVSATLDWFGARVRVGDHVIESWADTPVLKASPRMLTLGERSIRAALLLPTDHVPGTKLPVLMDPYGGPHAQRVVSAQNAFLASQWLADQGFAVLVADGRGTPGRGLAWERAIAFDFAGATLEDQVDALHAAAALEPDLDLTRVAIRGWSYGGYLSALAVLRRPDVFHAGIAGAPVTDWRLYDTHYTERYLGHPDDRPEVYDSNSLIADADKLSRPLMIIHGLADDNVVAAHTLRLSNALLAAGRPHTVLPLSGVTHMTPQEQVAENLLLLQVEFLKQSLV